MNDFKVGDEVKFTLGNPRDFYHGNEGVVTRTLGNEVVYVLFNENTWMHQNGYNMGGSGYATHINSLELLYHTSNIPEPLDADLI